MIVVLAAGFVAAAYLYQVATTRRSVEPGRCSDCGAEVFADGFCETHFDARVW
ncbi:hypothetical protein [Sphingomonas sp.]|uniref:hypothetical protein n=1 Tax=Sphingomonas sp. TaxID=28214 RepID=UPI002D7F0817|nr:hypothetical protein [Sphingomonas sp.]HEU0045060.1 hypothetical protein [Sphingomonas sp.]